MSLFARFFGILVLLGLTVPVLLSAQEKDKDKKDPKPAAGKKDKKDKDDKKDITDDEKPDPKKKDKKEAKKSEPEEKVVYGQVFTAKMKRIDANSNRDFTIELPMVDPMKVFNLQQWQAQQLLYIAQHQNSGTPQQKAQRVYNYQTELARRQNDIYSMKDFDLRGSEQVKVRSMYPPIEYDDRGFMKKWTNKELLALKGNSKLPGYPSAMESLRPGQRVQIYLAKNAQGPTKTQPKGAGKKKADDDDAAFDRPEAVMIVITQEVQPGGG